VARAIHLKDKFEDMAAPPGNVQRASPLNGPNDFVSWSERPVTGAFTLKSTFWTFLMQPMGVS